MEIIRTRNIAPWSLHMAHLEEKARTKFTSRACILTSNAASYNMPSLTHKEAFQRRLDIQAEVQVKDAFVDHNGRIDVRKLKVSLDSNLYKFNLLVDGKSQKDAQTGKKIWIEYEEFSSLVCSKYTSMYTQSKDRLDYLALRGKTFKAQVDAYPFDRAISAAVWLHARKNENTRVSVCKHISTSQFDDLVGIACNCDSYIDFLNEFVNYCLSNGLDLTKTVGDALQWQAYSDTIYENGNSLHPRASNKRLEYIMLQFESMKTSLTSIWTEVRDKHAFKLVAFGALIAGILGYFTLQKLTEKAAIVFTKPDSTTTEKWKSEPILFDAESRELGKTAPRKFVGESRELAKTTPRKFISEGVIDRNAKELTLSPVANNTYRIYTFRDNKWCPLMNGIFVRGRLLLTVGHCIPFMRERLMLRNAYVPDGLEFRFSDCTVCHLTNSENQRVDAVVLGLPRIVPSHRDLFDKFSQTFELRQFKGVQGNLYTCREFTKGKMSVMGSQLYGVLNLRAIDSERYELDMAGGKTEAFELRSGYLYKVETTPGDCGGPLVASCNSLQNKLLGIHVAGNSMGMGLAQLITQKMLSQAFKSFPFEAQIAIQCDYKLVVPQLPDGNFIPLGKTDHVVPAAVRTDLRKSVLYQLVKEPTTKPANLRHCLVDDEYIHPMMKGLTKCGGVCKPLNSDILKRCKTAVLALVRKNSGDVCKDILSLSDAIEGVEGDDFLTSINRRSSPGYPWIFQKGGSRGKSKWLGNDENFITDHPDVVSAVNKRISNARSGIRDPTIWIDTLKDERRPIEKVDAGKTRVFSAGSMDFILATRMYFLSFNAHVMRNRIDNCSAVGVNPYSYDWHRIAQKLQSKGKHVIAGDFSNFDGTLHPDIMFAILDVINEWYDDGEENKEIRTVLWQCIANSVHVFGDNLYQWTHSQPSGNPLTAILNTLYNIISMAYVFVDTTNRPVSDFF
jgi:hypothetical protein